jgi:predicted Ser/Thr protein kinase
MKKLLASILLVFASCQYIQPQPTTQEQTQQAKTPPFDEAEGYQTNFVTDTMASTIQQWIDWTKQELEKVGQLDNDAREKILNNLKERLVAHGNISDTEANEFVEKISPRVERLIRAFVSGNKIEIGLATISVLTVLIPFIIVIIRRRRNKK